MKYFLRITTFILLFLGILLHNVSARNLSPQAKITLLTCDPGSDLYTLFGHTALRVNDPKQNMDIVFNYGVFSFQTENFFWKFVKGETDYLLAAQTFPSFMREYQYEKRGVSEVELNLDEDQKQYLFHALEKNISPENREYRYNFLFDNCATKVRDKIVSTFNYVVKWPTGGQSSYTYRELINQFVPYNSWTSLGIYMALGKPCDQYAHFIEEMFLPQYLQYYVTHSTVVREKKRVNIGLEPHQLIEHNSELNSHKSSIVSNPTVVFALLFFIVLLLQIKFRKSEKALNLCNIPLFILAGLSGVIISFLAFVSTHPVTCPNFNLFWAHPLQLLIPIGLIGFASKEKFRNVFYLINIVCISIFLLLAISGVLIQTFHICIWIYSLMLLLVSIHFCYRSGILVAKKNK